MPAECLAYEEDLSALIDEELDATREAEVRAHVDACAHCMQRMQELCNVDLVLAALPAPPVAHDLEERLAARIAADAPSVTPLRRPPAPAPRPARRRAFYAAAAGVAAAAALALALLLGLPRDASEPGVPIARETPPEPAPQLVPEPSAPDTGAIAEAPVPVPPPPALERVPEAPAPDETIVAHAAPAPPSPAPEPEAAAELAALDALPDEDVALALDLDLVEDLDLMANLDLLEALVDLGVAEGA